MKRYLRPKGVHGIAALVATAVTFSPIALTPTLLNQASAAITPGAILNLDASNASSYSGSGDTWTDLTGNGYNATITASGSGYTRSYDAINRAISFSNGTIRSQNAGASASIAQAIPAQSWIGFSATFSANMGVGGAPSGGINDWSRVFDFSASGFTQGNGAKGGIFISRFERSNNLHLAFTDMSTTKFGECEASGIISNEAFAHYAVTVSGDGTCIWYKDGVAWRNYISTGLGTQTNVNNGSTGSNQTLPTSDAKTSLRIARSHWNDVYLSGSIRNLAVYNGTLSSAQITANYNVQSGLSTDSTLSGISVSSAALSPSFSSGRASYTASVTNAVSTIGVTSTVNDAGARAQIKLGGGSYSNMTNGSPSSISLAEGANTITILVTAQDGSTTSTYTIVVTRATIKTIDFSNLPATPVQLNFREASLIKITMASPGKATFFANGRRIPGCINLAASSLVSCSYKPLTHGGITLSARVLPNSGSPYTVQIPVGAAVRSTQR